MLEVNCPACQSLAPVQWIKEEHRYRYQRHYLVTGRRCPASGEPAKMEGTWA